MRGRRWLLGGLGLFLVFFFEAASQPFLAGDEPWTLQILHRLAAGDVLYRDVFFGSMPFSIYFTSAFTKVLGTEILVLRALSTLLFVVTVLLFARTVQRVAPGAWMPVLAALALVSLSARLPNALYTPLASLFLFLCFLATLSWEEKERTEGPAGKQARTRLVWAGLLAGLACVSKQNVGLLAFAAVVVALVVVPPRGGSVPKRVAMFGAAFLLPVVVVLLPVWWSGGVTKLLEYGFLNKGTYVRIGGVSYLEGFRRWPGFLLHPEWSWDELRPLSSSVRYLVAPATVAAIAWSWLRTPLRDRRRAVIVSAFCVAAFLTAFPRFDASHLTYSLPILLTGLIYGMEQGGARRRRWLGWSLALFFGLFQAARFGWNLVPAVRGLVSSTWTTSRIPHFRGVFIPEAEERRLYENARRMAAFSEGRPLLILTPYPSVYYLASGTRNPTPFDYPLRTALGLHGETEILAALQNGRISSVCFARAETDPQRPLSLEEFVLRQMDPVVALDVCTLYRSRALRNPEVGEKE